MTQRKTARRRTPTAHPLAATASDPLRSLATFAARAFPSSDAAKVAALEVLRDLCPCSVIFLARANGDAPGQPVRLLGATRTPKDEATAAAFLHDNAARLASLAAPTIIGDVADGTHGTGVVVPLCTSAGQMWGWLVGIEPPPHLPSQETLQVLAGLVMRHIENAAPNDTPQTPPMAVESIQGQTAELEAVVTAMSDALFVHDRNGHMVRMNPAGQALLAVEAMGATSLPGEMSDRAARWDLRDANGQPMPPEAWPLTRVLRGEQFAGDNAVDVWMHAADGRERLISFSGAPIRASDGTISGAVTLAHDVTLRRRMERRTQIALESLLGMATALVGMPDSASHEQRDLHRVVDLTQQVLAGQFTCIARVEIATGTLTPEAVVGLTPEIATRWWTTLTNSSIDNYLPPAELARLIAGETLQIDLAGAPPVPGQDYFGVQLVLVVAAQLVNGELCILVVEARDRAAFAPADVNLARAAVQLAALVIERERFQRERAEAQARELTLQATNDQMLTFLGIAGHELRTPVTGLKITAQLAERAVIAALRDALPPTATKALTRAQGLLATADRQVGKLNTLIGDLLDVTRIQAGKLDLRPAEVDLAALARTTTEEQQMAWPDRTITLDLPAQPALLCCDADRVEQVITNFLTNALKYSPDDQPITVTVQPLVDGVRVAVTDHGPGIPPAAQAQLWELFHQVPGIQQQSGAGIGLGIGLYLCRTIIERHGGQVGVDSQPDHGATFWFTLPLVPTIS